MPIDNQPAPVTAKMSTPSPKKTSLLPKLLLGFLVIILLVGIGGFFLLYLPLKDVAQSAQQVMVSGQAVSGYLKAQDLPGIQNQLVKVKTDLTTTRSKFAKLSWLNVVPLARNYYQDGLAGFSAADDLISAGEVTIEAIAPYADVIGLKGLTTTGDGGKTAQDRINFIVNTLDKLQPQLTNIGEKLSSAQNSLAKIDPNRYPEKIGDLEIKSNLVAGQNLLSQTSTMINTAKPLLASAPYILGVDSPRKYLVLFQNDAEIRGTGGFLTGYAVINIAKGKISTVQSDDIYKLDEKFPKRITAPAPILKYMPLVPYWYLRDQNLSPDFRVSMETFLPNYLLTKSPEVDGIIAVDTQLLVDLLKVTGPIGVSGLGTFSADTDPRCNCPQVFYELQILAGGEAAVVWDSVTGKIVQAPANYLNRKAFLGPMMYSILANVMAQPKGKVPLLVNTIFENIQAKHLLMYFLDPQAQTAAESFNIAGRVRETDGDYLMVVDTNFAGAKTNIWVTYKADQKVTIAADGTVTKTLTLTYSNPQTTAVHITQARNLNGMFRNWLRVYVPKGSQLVDIKDAKDAGFETGLATGEDLGKTVFEGFFTLTPGNTKQIKLTYTVPFKAASQYKLLIQKQGGSKNFPYQLSLNGRSQPEVILSGDIESAYPY